MGQIQLLAQMTDEQMAGGIVAALIAFISGFAVLFGILGLFFMACYWKVFSKAGQPGWAAFVPIYNVVVLLQIVGRPGWWFFLLCIPFVNAIVGIIVVLDLAKSYGKDNAFAAGLIILGPIFLPILAFGSAEYQGPAALAGDAAAGGGDAGGAPVDAGEPADAGDPPAEG